MLAGFRRFTVLNQAQFPQPQTEGLGLRQDRVNRVPMFPTHGKLTSTFSAYAAAMTADHVYVMAPPTDVIGPENCRPQGHYVRKPLVLCLDLHIHAAGTQVIGNFQIVTMRGDLRTVAVPVAKPDTENIGRDRKGGFWQNQCARNRDRVTVFHSVSTIMRCVSNLPRCQNHPVRFQETGLLSRGLHVLPYQNPPPKDGRHRQ